MKTILIVLLTAINLNAKTIKEGDTTYTCSPVKTCEDELKQAKAEIAKLKKQIKNQKPVVVTKEVIVEKEAKPVVYRFETIKKVHKYHLVSIVYAPDIYTVEAKNISNNEAKAEARSKRVPGLIYQYQFDNGLTPLVGININGSLSLGLGLEF
jgi:hypothetical protein